MSNFDVNILKHADVRGAGPLLFTVVRNESYLLPHFFRHYRRLGVERFAVFDDHSTDGTLELLQAEDRCLVLGSDVGYGDTAAELPSGRKLRFGPYLRMELPAQLAPQDWVLTVDADEFLVLPPQFETLPQLVGVLDEAGQTALTAPMVDFYPARLADRKSMALDTDPFKACPYFDRGPYYDWNGTRAPVLYARGIRARLTRMLVESHPDVAARLFGAEPKYPSLSKVPLLKNGHGLQRATNAHELTTPPPPGISASLAHFKFGPDLDARIAHALASNAYENASMGYRFLQAVTEAFDQVSLVGEETVIYEGPRSLRDAGLMEPVGAARQAG